MIVLHNLCLAESMDMELQIWRNHICGRLTKLYVEFWLYKGLMYLMTSLFEGQLY